MQAMRDQAAAYFHSLQDAICDGLAEENGAGYIEDAWERPGGGGGRSRVFASARPEDGCLLEKGGVNVSVVHGQLSPEAARAMLGRKVDAANPPAFFATGLSLVLHPFNPHVPTVHANFRYFETDGAESGQDSGNKDSGPGKWWFGGGADLTPYLLYEEDAVHFHQTWKEVCDGIHPDFYPKYKKDCDEYFYLAHRQEARGVGGIFFDNYQAQDPQETLAHVQSISGAFLDSWLPIAKKRRHIDFTDEQKKWQLLRRGRYVEFNLVYDRGTVFGLKTNARMESVLMSLPPVVHWDYNPQPPDDPRCRALLYVVREPRDWIK